MYDLKTEYEKIQKELDMYKQCYEDNVVRYNELLDRYNELKASSSQERIQEKGDDYEEMKANCEYYRRKFQRCKRGYELVIELTYKYAAKNMKIEKSEYKEQLAEEVNNLLDEQYGRD